MHPKFPNVSFKDYMHALWDDTDSYMESMESDLDNLLFGLERDKTSVLRLCVRGKMSQEDCLKALTTIDKYKEYVVNERESIRVLRKYLTSYDAWMDEEEEE